MTAPTLTEFLLARIAEDEAAARRLLRYAQENELAVGEPQMLGRRIPGWHEWPDVQVMCSRVLAECEAKRRIVALHQPHQFLAPVLAPVTDAPGDFRLAPGPVGCSFCDEAASSGVEWPCRHLRILASVYADHPGYREEWRP